MADSGNSSGADIIKSILAGVRTPLSFDIR